MNPSQYMQKHKKALSALPWSCQNLILNCARIVNGQNIDGIDQHVNRMSYRASDDIYNALHRRFQQVSAADITRICHFRESVYAFLNKGERQSWTALDNVLTVMLKAVNRS